jgi:hypothetical protein
MQTPRFLPAYLLGSFLTFTAVGAPLSLNFEGGTLAGLTVSGQGSATVLTSLGGINPLFGSNMALLSNGPGDLGGTPDSVRLLSDPFTIAPAEMFVFSIRRVTAEPTGALAALLDSFTINLIPFGGGPTINLHSSDVSALDYLPIAGAPVATFAGETFYDASDWLTISYLVTGTYQVEFLVSDDLDNSFDSGFLIDAETTSSTVVPEPNAFSLLLVGGAGLFLWKRRGQLRLRTLSMATARLAGFAALAMAGMGMAEATHFRYGHVVTKTRPDIAGNTAEITIFASFRRSGYGAPVVGTIISEDVGGTDLQFGDGATLTGSDGSLDFRVLAIDVANDWIYTVALNPTNVNLPIIHTYPSAGPWEVGINSCCRISSLRNGADTQYRVMTTINFATDVSTAVSTVPTIVNCFTGINCPFFVPAGDSDGDVLFWRFATLAEAGGGMSNPPPGMSINSTTGEITWATAGRTLGLYGVQVIIESRTAAGVVKSKAAVDFLANLAAGTPSGSAPVFSNTTLLCGQTLDVAAGKAISFTVRAQDVDAGNVTLNAIGLPTGSSMTPGLPIAANPVQSVFNWTAATTQIGTTVVVFTATDPTGRQTTCNVVLQVRGDKDGDGLPDIWETTGYTHNGVFVNLPAMGANQNHKDIFVEIDYMVGRQPMAAAITSVINAFAAVPNAQFAIPNPDGLNGITLHVNVDDSITFVNDLGATVGGSYDWSAFEALKTANFQAQLAPSHHYGIWANQYGGGTSSGISRGIPSNDFIVSLGAFTPVGGTQAQQAGTFMHEFGHNMGLGHGGPLNLAVPAGQVNVNYKPNYLSIMNYAFQMSGLLKGGLFGTLDYSRMTLPSLNEASLNENVGLNSALANTYGTVWYCGNAKQTGNVSNGPLDWNCSTTITAGVSTDLNRTSGATTTLQSFNDWGNMNFTGGSVGAGATVEPPLMTSISDELDLTTVSVEPPSAPIGLAFRVLGGTLRLTWNPLAKVGDVSYRIYRKIGAGAFTQIGTATLPTFSLTPGPGSSQYYVTGVSLYGVESLPSNIITVSLP